MVEIKMVIIEGTDGRIDVKVTQEPDARATVGEGNLASDMMKIIAYTMAHFAGQGEEDEDA